MLKRMAVVLVMLAVSVGCASAGKSREVVRIDATSIGSAEASYSEMMDSLSASEQRRLGLAVLVISMEDVKSAYEVVGSKELQSPSIGRVKDKVAGMSADEIISLAARTSKVRIEPAGQ